MNVREILSEQFGNCIQLTKGGTEVMVTLDYGPRIVSVKKDDGIQFIYNGEDEALGKKCGHKMRITLDKSTNGIYCDSSPVRYSPTGSGVRLVQTVTEPVQMEAVMEISFTEEDDIRVEHSVMNKSKENLKLSIYTETPFAEGGFVFAAQGRAVTPEKPGKIMTLWDGCSWSDIRLTIDDEYVKVRSCGKSGTRLKIGVNDTEGFAGYISGDFALVKNYTHNINALYPFYNCSVFATENGGYLTLQMTSPFYLVEPEEAARHVEIWQIRTDIKDDPQLSAVCG